jgi:tRNA threonylcarbamoyladenosine biosynthesis protein TsaE
MNARTIETTSAAETEALGARLAAFVPNIRLVYIRGALGAGKTTLVRGLLRGLGHTDAVKSPTFTLVEPYTFSWGVLNHFDLYRMNDPEEIEFLAFRDYLGNNSLCVVEWPERAGHVLPVPDLDVMMRADNNGGRNVRLQAHSPAGEDALRAL